jgi:hypothetical protein
MTNPNGHGGRRPGAGRPKSRHTLLREATEELLRDLPQLHQRRQSSDQVVDELRRLTAAVHRLRESQRSESESLQPIRVTPARPWRLRRFGQAKMALDLGQPTQGWARDHGERSAAQSRGSHFAPTSSALPRIVRPFNSTAGRWVECSSST